MEIGDHAQVELVDLCTPKLEMNDLTATLPLAIPQMEDPLVIDNIERCSKFDPRLSILPLYPTSDLQEQYYPLLANIPCKSSVLSNSFN